MSRAMCPALRSIAAVSLDAWDVESIRQHFLFPQAGRIATNNAASTQPPRELIALYTALAPQYENVHRGQSSASHFLGTLNPLAAVRAIADASGYVQPDGERRSYLLIDGAQLVPGSFIDVQALDVDYLSFSFHKMLAPFGVGALVAKEHLLEASLPFLYGGDMVAEGKVFEGSVGYNALPWKYAAGTPNILGSIVSAQALRLLLDLASPPGQACYFDSDRSIERRDVEFAMRRVSTWCRRLTARALERLGAIEGITIHGPREAARRSALVAFDVAGHDPFDLARAFNDAGIEARAGCHCATLAHQALGVRASCRLSFYFYNTLDEVDRVVDALADIVSSGYRR